MEVARKGIFNPEMFYLQEIMVIFLAVMITDVMLLDLYNTFALPTSTTVSIVFELLGASVAVSLVKIANASDGVGALIDYINTSKALAIISGILLSVVIAFTVGAIIQYITRLIFTFDYKKRLKRYGALWGAAALSLITYFILIKGAKGSSIITGELYDYIETNWGLLLLIGFGFWVVVLQLVLWFTNINILKPIVLIGTFALALAFAANDLVNFIGVPLAGLSSYLIGLESADPMNTLMEGLREPVQSNTFILIGAGAVMAVTLWLSKKAKSVTKTEVNLGRQTEGYERFESSMLARTIVRMASNVFDTTQKLMPPPLKKKLSQRMDESAYVPTEAEKKDKPAFDLLRASVNLMVASSLISMGTSLKLPLSTTYVTFMVAMGTSLSDKAWGRESAVYRVNGVLTVIGGWFFTAFTAFTVAAIVALVIFYWQLPAIIVLLALAGYFIYRTHGIHEKRSKESEEYEKASTLAQVHSDDALERCMTDISTYLNNCYKNLSETFNGLENWDRQQLKQAKKTSKKINQDSNRIIGNILQTIKAFKDEEFEKGYRYGKVIGSIEEVAANINSISKSSFDHVDNNHKKLSKDQLYELAELDRVLGEQIEESNKYLAAPDAKNIKQVEDSVKNFEKTVQKFDKNQVKRIKKGASSTKANLLYLSILSDIENLSKHVGDITRICEKTRRVS
jgi:phosphate/sulfate permease